jgi:hypothetical protein
MRLLTTAILLLAVLAQTILATMHGRIVICLGEDETPITCEQACTHDSAPVLAVEHDDEHGCNCEDIELALTDLFSLSMTRANADDLFDSSTLLAIAPSLACAPPLWTVEALRSPLMRLGPNATDAVRTTCLKV